MTISRIPEAWATRPRGPVLDAEGGPPRSSRTRFTAAWLASLSIGLASCDGTAEGRVPVHPASGRVLFQGKPLPDALVVLRPEGSPGKGGGPPRPTGRTDADGRFRLHTYAGDDGAPAGSYLVGISVAPALAENRDLMRKALTKERERPRVAPDPLGTRYADPDSSGLKAEIKAGENELPPFDLK